MASTAIRASTCLCSSTPSSTPKHRPTNFNNLSSSLTFHSKTPRFNLYSFGLRGHFSPWCGLKHLGLFVTWRSIKLANKRGRDRVAQASLFGVGAPEALVIGVVALLVFGPKGLAEVARSLGKTLRAFQPTIRELQEVSREFKSTLEKEIGLDEISGSTSTTQRYNATTTTTTTSPISNATESKIAADPNGTSSPDGAYTSEELLKVTEEKLKALTSNQEEEISSQPHLEAQAKPQDITSLSNETSTKEAEPNVGSSEVKENGQVSSPAATSKENTG